MQDIGQYLILVGMFEQRKGFSYRPIKAIHEVSNTWKENDGKIETNKLNIEALKFDLSDVNLVGTASTPEQIINRLQLRLNFT